MSLTHTADGWERLDKLFKQAMALPADEVDAFCRTACGSDQELYECRTKRGQDSCRH